MKILVLIAALVILALPVQTLAQEEAETAVEPTRLERLQKLAELITTSEDARQAGIPEEEVAEALEGARERGLSADEAEAVLAESTAAVNESGPVDNFGAFVQSKLDEGLRGKELADAIHEEHRRHGKGKGHGKHKVKKEKHEGDKPDHQGRHSDGDHDDDDAEDDHGEDPDRDHDDDHDDDDDDDDRGKGHGKSGKKDKGNK